MTKCFVLITLIGCCAVAHANLITNGSFENGNFVADGNNSDSLAVGSTDMTGWTVDTFGIAWIQNPDPFDGIVASDGFRSLDLTGYTDSIYGGVHQTFATTVGVLYQVQFDLGQNANYGPSDIYASVNNGALNEFSIPYQGTVTQLWKTETFDFVGFDSSATLSFVGATNLGGTRYIGLDNVVVTVVPEPISMTLIGLGACAILRRKTR